MFNEDLLEMYPLPLALKPKISNLNLTLKFTDKFTDKIGEISDAIFLKEAIMENGRSYKTIWKKSWVTPL